MPLEPVHLSSSVVTDLKSSKTEPAPWWLRFLPHAIIALLGAGAGAASRVRSEER